MVSRLLISKVFDLESCGCAQIAGNLKGFLNLMYFLNFASSKESKKEMTK